MDKRAMFYGALAQSVPDVDFITAFFLHGAENVFLLFAVNIFVHLFIDTFNAYGVALLMPFSHYKYTMNVLFVADPLFSLAPFISFLFLLFLNKSHKRRVMWIRTGIFVSAAYLCIAIINKQIVNRAVYNNLVQQNKPTEFFTTPSPFNSLLWFVAAKDTAGYYTSYRSVFDKGGMNFTYFPRNEKRTDTVSNQKDIALLKEFAQGYYTFEQWGDTAVMNVLRFGQVVGWYDPREKFAFHYLLSFPQENDLVVQRGRFMHWNEKTTEAFFRRMFGEKRVASGK